MVRILYDRGTIILEAPPEFLPPFFHYDERDNSWRALGRYYFDTITWLKERRLKYDDRVFASTECSLKLYLDYALRPYQKEAIEKFTKNNFRGMIILPTGAGKTLLGIKIIEQVAKATLVLVPTIDLMNQWYSILTDAFRVKIGLLGGGYHELENITVSTYDSGYIWSEQIGNKFYFIIFDEVHHLPAESNIHIAEMCCAPYRLGLTATYALQDRRHSLLSEIVGQIVYQKTIDELTGKYLSEYEVIRLSTELTAEEQQEYRSCQEKYLRLLRDKKINLYSSGWTEFIKRSTYDDTYREALLAFQKARYIIFNAKNKIHLFESLLKQHYTDRVIVFTELNDMVYWLSENFLLPAITHETKVKERKKILDKFSIGEYSIIVTSKVLDEGINVPEANVGIIISGSSSSRQHIQRLGRLLRPKENKKALLYELVTKGTKEVQISYRRKKSNAYNRISAV